MSALQKDYSQIDTALAFLAPYGTDLSNGFSNHAPMTVEALSALGQSGAIMPWLEKNWPHRTMLTPRETAHAPIDADSWRDALGKKERGGDWETFFNGELKTHFWQQVVATWVPRLAPGFCADAVHGAIRTGHAVRSLDERETPARKMELAAALGYWAKTYRTLPDERDGSAPVTAAEAIRRVRFVPDAQKTFRGSITSGLVALGDFAPFSPVIGWLDVSGDLSRTLSQLTETLARVYLANARDGLTTIVFIHGVTGAAAARSLIPHLADEDARALVSSAWQTGSALYAAFGTAAPDFENGFATNDAPQALIDAAVATADEHAIKFTEACLREYALNPSPAYLTAARHAIDTLAS
ncbi:MAG TPA: questin oxidase family protein [Rhizomicrobium sp.]